MRRFAVKLRHRGRAYCLSLVQGETVTLGGSIRSDITITNAGLRPLHCRWRLTAAGLFCECLSADVNFELGGVAKNRGVLRHGECLKIGQVEAEVYDLGRPVSRPAVSDAPTSDAPTSDALSSDALSSDALSSDALSSDALSSDALSSDALSSDAGVSDALASDALASDALASDALASDALANEVTATDAERTSIPPIFISDVKPETFPATATPTSDLPVETVIEPLGSLQESVAMILNTTLPTAFEAGSSLAAPFTPRHRPISDWSDIAAAVGPDTLDHVAACESDDIYYNPQILDTGDDADGEDVIDTIPGLPPSEVHESESLDAEIPERPHVEPKHVEPKHVEPEHVEPEHVEPEHVEPEHVEPEHVEPAVVESGQVEIKLPALEFSAPALSSPEPSLSEPTLSAPALSERLSADIAAPNAGPTIGDPPSTVLSGRSVSDNPNHGPDILFAPVDAVTEFGQMDSVSECLDAIRLHWLEQAYELDATGTTLQRLMSETADGDSPRIPQVVVISHLPLETLVAELKKQCWFTELGSPIVLEKRLELPIRDSKSRLFEVCDRIIIFHSEVASLYRGIRTTNAF
jgi:pentapeptide MXKDX repeat protein